MKLEEIIQESRERGYSQGLADRDNDYRNEAPLSGEWAGESINELLGDLLSNILAYGDDFYDEVCVAYEEGYEEAHATVMG